MPRRAGHFLAAHSQSPHRLATKLLLLFSPPDNGERPERPALFWPEIPDADLFAAFSEKFLNEVHRQDRFVNPNRERCGPNIEARTMAHDSALRARNDDGPAVHLEVGR